MDASASKMGGIIGVFFMALTLALVSFSCTGPILGGLLGSTALASGDVATNLSVGMFGFGIALAFPFALFALFPGMLSSLPKSGGWMLTVKVFLGFLELGLAFKFLSNADLVGHWGLLKREVFLGIWMLLSVGLAAYLLGVFDKVKKSIHWSRFPWILGALVFGSFMLLGILKKQDLAWLSGFPPPSFYSLYEQESDCPLGLECYKDFETGLSAAKAANKPILLDFTGWACVNCRRMEENVWRDPSVFNKINNEFVLISLYIDDRSPLIESEQFIFQFASGRQKPITTVGQKWGTFQTVNFNAASQPYYVLLSPNLYILGPAIQYTNIGVYDSWLEAGLNEFKKQ
jgi:thiol:disulfide interchange protein DsbD